jgi:uncharacterized membrane protein YbhN (UPF0104 family)
MDPSSPEPPNHATGPSLRQHPGGPGGGGAQHGLPGLYSQLVPSPAPDLRAALERIDGGGLLPAPGGDAPASRRRPVGRTITYLVALIVPLLAVGWIALNWSTVRAGTDLLRGVSYGWLVGAAGAAGLTWVAGALCQQGAVLDRLPVVPLLAVQFAGSAANHLLPAGVGVAAINMRFLRRRGLSRASALRAVGLNTGAGVSVHLVALAVLLCAGLVAPEVLAGRAMLILIVGAALGAVGLVLASVPRIRQRGLAVGRHQLGAAAAQWSELARRPARVLQLWAGSAAVPLLHATTLALLTTALGGRISVGTVFGAYFLATAISAAIPSPGGFGSLDAALILALTAGGLSPAVAVAAVIGYRLITVWVPLLPSACVMGVLRHRAVI